LIKKIFKHIKNNGFKTFVSELRYYIFPIKIKNWKLLKEALTNKIGIEIGGPSSIFNKKGTIPVYLIAKKIDGCNFSNQTTWEGNIAEGYTYNYFKNKSGYQFIREGSDLSIIKDNTYDFVLSCHNLEHFANPLKALKEWHRILKKGGILLLVLPDKTKCFDLNREITDYNHIISDYKNDVSEDDMTHLSDVLSKTDLELYPDYIANTLDTFTEACRDNFKNRCMHHHVFNFELLKKILNYISIDVLFTEKAEPHHLIIVGKK